MFQIMSFYLVPAQTQRGFGGESSQHLIHLSSPLAPLLPLPVHRSDKAGRPSGYTVLPNEPDLGMRGELVKDNHAV